MTTPESGRLIPIEPLDPAKHDQASFFSGVEQVDRFFWRTASKLTKAGHVRTFVMVARGQFLPITTVRSLIA